jgi:oxazoline/thiazoline dehydrogenase
MSEPTLTLNPSAELLDEGERTRIEFARRSVAIPTGSGLEHTVRALQSGVTEAALHAAALGAGGFMALRAVQQVITRLDALGILFRTLHLDDAPLVRLEPLSGRCPTPVSDAPDGTVSLSRFAMVHRDGISLVVESPRGHGRLRLFGGRGAGILGALTEGTDASELADVLDCDPADAGAVLRCFEAAGATTPGGQGETSEDDDPRVRRWEAHDLLFHARSRTGRQSGGYGGSFRFEGDHESPPLRRPSYGGERILLKRFDPATWFETDAPFGTVLEARRTRREQGEEPMTLDQLAEFLFRSARVAEHHKNEQGEVTRRVYPAGGAIYETEIYPVVDRVEGLPSGLYRYDPFDHALERVAERTPSVETLLTMAYYTAAQRSRPQVMLAMTARFGRIQWKYEGMAYSAVLKNLGGLYQTFYLVAEEMGLAACALGGGDSDLFAEAAGLDYMEETTVGEFVLGSRQGDQ